MWRMAFVSAIGLALGCGEKSDDGELGGHCYPNATCNVGLRCAGGVCVVADAAIDAPALDAAGDAMIDARVCDTTFEPNDTITTAYATGVAVTMSTRTILAIGICPADDVDHFGIAITTALTDLEVFIDVGVGPALELSVLNAGGSAIANGSPVSGMPQRIRAVVPNLPTGNYYARVRAAAQMTNTYDITLTVTGP